MFHPTLRTFKRGALGVAAVGLLTSSLTACGSDDGAGEAASGGEGGSTAVTLITKDSINPFFVSMQEGAEKAAEEHDVDLTIAAGEEDGDEEGQIQAIESAIAQGQDGILITPNG